MNKTERELDFVLKYVRPEISKKYGVATCILSTKGAVTYLREVMPDAEIIPFVVSVQIMNPGWIKMVESVRLNPQLETEEYARKAVQEGAHCCAAGFGHPDERGFDGHMIALVTRGSKHWLLDMSFDQFHRPTKGIECEPYWLRLSDKMFDNLIAGEPIYLESNNGCVVEYKHMPEKAYEQAPDWKTEFHFKFQIPYKDDRLDI